MQFNQRSGATPGSDNNYWRQLDQDIDRLRRRSRRQFLTTASGLVGGTALLLGGTAWFSQPHAGALFGGPAACQSATPIKSTLSPANPSVLKVAQISKSVNFFSFYVAQQQNYFKAQGLSIATPPLLQTGSKLAAAVAAGTYDVGNGVITDAFAWSRTDSSARVIGSLMNGYAIDVVASNSFYEQTGISASSSLNTKIQALKGKKIGITGPNSGTQALVIYLLRLVGLDALKDCTWLSLGSNNAAALAALKTNQVDAISFASPFGQAVEGANAGSILVSPVRGDVPAMVGEVQAVCYASQKVIESKPQEIAAYLRALNQAQIFVKNNPDLARGLLNTYLGLGQAVSDKVYDAISPVMPTSPIIGQPAFNAATKFHVQAGLIALAPSYSSLVAASTIDSALGLNAACQS